MKKLTITFLCCLMAIAVQAQVEHLTFMGIPINGSIAQFQSKLQAKGIRYNAAMSKRLQAGCRTYDGMFSGESATIYVYYDTKTKKVYRAKAVITYNNRERGENELRNYKEKLVSKYVNGVPKDGQQEGYPSFYLLLPNSKGNCLGSISLYITNTGYLSIDNTVYLHIDYEDGPNSVERDRNNLDDL